MLLIALLACHIDEDFDCQTTTREVGEDEVLGDIGLTAAEVAQAFVGEHSFDATYLRTEETTAVSLTVARRAEPAVFHDAEMVPTKELKPGLFEYDTMMAVSCDDRAELPVDVAITAADGAVNASGATTASADVHESLFIQGGIEGPAILPEQSGGADGSFHASFAEGEVARFQLGLADDRVLEYPME